ncbi:glycosyltransferase family 2 protein [Candidatus Saccharibacteria bacterium]|nr:glycosyltransferase family 2 protein [Candidatus Saccharibacteria bacterium]
MKKVAILIPCYNEELTVGKVVDDFKKVFSKYPAETTIYVYDNNSKDKTAKIAKKHGAVVRSETRQGKGNVVRSMFREIDADCYIMADGDDTNCPFGDKKTGTVCATEIADQVLNNKVDMVVGRRHEYFAETGDKKLVNGLGNRLVTKLIQKFFKTEIQDILTGFRGFSRGFVKTFAVDKGGFTLETELTIHGAYYDVKMVELDTTYRERPDGSESKITLKDGVKILWMFTTLVLNYKPIFFWGICGLVSIVIGVSLAISPFIEFFETGLVNKFPSLIVSVLFIILAFLFWTVSIIVKLVNKNNRRQFETNYNSFNC